MIEDPTSRIEALLATAEPLLAASFLRMVLTAKDLIPLGELADLLERGLWEEALNRLVRAAPLLGETYVDSYIASAKDTARFLNVSVGEVQFVFDQTNTRAVAEMQSNMLRLVKGLTEQQRESVRSALIEGIRRGSNPIEMARAFRNSIGLTSHQERAVLAFRRALEEGNPAVLQRALRDRRFDQTLRRTLAGDGSLGTSQIDRMVDRYRDRMLDYRAKTIARTEALRSAHQGVNALYRQAIEDGELSAQNMTQEWVPVADDRTRDPHSAMAGQTQPLGTPFISGAGNSLRYPGDEAAPAEEVINCRCIVSTRIVKLPVVA